MAILQKLLVVAMLVSFCPMWSMARDREIRIRTSWAGLHVLEALVRQYEQRTPIRVALLPLESDAVVSALVAHQADVGVIMHSRLTLPDGDAAMGVRRKNLGNWVVAVLVNSRSPVRNISVRQLSQVFQGHLVTWQETSFTNVRGPVELYSPTAKSLETYILRHKAMAGAQLAWGLRDLRAEPVRQKLSPEAIVAEVAREARAIGFCRYDFGASLDDRVRVLAISREEIANGVLPTPGAVASGSYALMDTLAICVHSEPTQEAFEFVEFTTGPEGANIIKQYGLWPEYELRRIRGDLRLKEMQAGKGTPIRVCGVAGGEPLARDLAVPYVKAKAVVQVKYREQGSQAGAMSQFMQEGELLLHGSGEPEVESGTRSATLGTLAVGVVVHPESAAKELTLEDLRLIYSGEIDKWPGVEGTEARIRMFGLASDSPVMRLVEETVGSGQWAVDNEKREGTALNDGSPPPTTHHSPSATRHARIERRPDTEKVVLSVANQPGAIGFVDLARVDRHETRVKLVAILAPGAKKAEVPTPEKVPEGYPLARPVMLYLSPKASETAKDFFEFVAGGNAREALVAHGIIPNPNPPKFGKDKTLAAVKSARSGDLRRTDGEPEKPEAKAAPGPEELASVLPKEPAERLAADGTSAGGPAAKGPSGEAASGKGEPAKTGRPHPDPLPEGEGASDARYFAFGVVGLLVIAVAVIGVNTMAARRRRERLSRYRR